MTFLTIAFIGLLGGFSSGLFGIGGGTLFVPLLIILLGFNMHVAIGTSIAVIIPTAAMAALRHHLGAMVDWKTVAFLTVFALLGAWLGAELSLKMDTAVLRKAFAVFLFAVALKIFFQN